MKKNIAIITLAIALIGSIWYQSTADYTMTTKQAIEICGTPHTAPILFPSPNSLHRDVPAVFYSEGVQEDDLYIEPEDIGKVDLKRMPNN